METVVPASVMIRILAKWKIRNGPTTFLTESLETSNRKSLTNVAIQ